MPHTPRVKASLSYLDVLMTTDAPHPTIRRAVSGDAAALADLGRRTFSDAFAAHNTPHDMALFLEAAYAPAIQARELADAARTCLVAERDGVLLAYALLRSGTQCEFLNDPTAVELQRFYVDASCHGTGLAQALMAACIAAAHALHAGALFLGVWERNGRAIRFYEVQGFQAVGRQSFVLGTDTQQDLVMTRTLRPGQA